MRVPFASLVFLASIAASPLHAETPTPPPPGYALVWHDEFNHDGKPNPANWTYEHGFVRGGELQWYQPQNARVEDGKLVIEARRAFKPNPMFHQPGVNHPFDQRRYIHFTSASLTTRDRHPILYGRIDIRAKFPAKEGLWPALWFVGEKGHWPANGEIDLFEYYANQIHANFAWAAQNLHHPFWKSRKIPLGDWTSDPDWDQKFHTWTMIWTPSRITLLLDGRQLNTLNLQHVRNVKGAFVRNPFLEPHYLIMNLALGGKNGGPVRNLHFPQRFEVDYVRVYRRIDHSGSGTTASAVDKIAPAASHNKDQTKDRK